MRQQPRIDGIPILLQDTVEAAVPQWPARLKRRWLHQFVPHWRPELVDETRLARYLAIALRRGWFDEATGARRWTLFVRYLEGAESRRSPISPAAAVNGFNLVAAVPVADYSCLDALSASDWATLVEADGPLGAEALARLVRVAQPIRRSAASRLSSPIIRLLDGQVLHSRGRRWLGLDLSASGLRLVHIVEPFGLKAWDGVSEVGVDGDALVAWSRPLGLVARLEAPDFPVTVTRGEPTRLLRPTPRALPGEVIAEVFPWRGLWVGRTYDGAVAFLESVPAP